MSGASPIAPTISDLRTLLAGARELGGTSGAVLEMCILCLCLPWEAALLDIERIDWSTGIVSLPTRRGWKRPLALSTPAQKAILRIAGSTVRSGQVVTAGRGDRFKAGNIRLDRLQDELADLSPAYASFDWNFHGIRQAGADALTAAGRTRRQIAIALGRDDRSEIGSRERSEIASLTMETWSRLLFDDRSCRTDRAP